MGKHRSYRFNKLSVRVPVASIETARKKLGLLHQFLEESYSLPDDIAKVVSDLRKVTAADNQPFVFTTNIDENETLLRSILENCDDIRYRRFSGGNRRVLMVYLSGMVDKILLEKSIVEAIIKDSAETGMPNDAESLIHHLLTAVEVTIVTKADTAIQNLLAGHTLLLVDGMFEVIVVEAKKHVKRSVEKSESEDIIRGPRHAFNETLDDNVVLLRRTARDADLKVKLIKIGQRTQTAVAIVYVADLVKPGLAAEVERRLRKANTDKATSSFSIEELIIDHPWTPFPQAQGTERPDKVIAAVYEGRVGIIVDNTPIALLVPTTFASLMQTSDDYTTPALVVSLIRATRILSSFIAIFLPAIYLSAVSYHPGMLPTTLAISIAELRTRTPFPSLLEVIMMESLLEIFQEAIIRLPQKIAGAAGVVGALVIGTTVVQAGLVNPLLVVVVAITALASFSMPTFGFGMALRFFRVPMLVLGSILGLYGVIMGFIAIVIHLCSLTSFGETFAGGLFDVTLMEDWKDTIIRTPANTLQARTKEFGSQDRTRGRNENIG